MVRLTAKIGCEAPAIKYQHWSVVNYLRGLYISVDGEVAAWSFDETACCFMAGTDAIESCAVNRLAERLVAAMGALPEPQPDRNLLESQYVKITGIPDNGILEDVVDTLCRDLYSLEVEYRGQRRRFEWPSDPPKFDTPPQLKELVEELDKTWDKITRHRIVPHF
jgi:hypothetical protein